MSDTDTPDIPLGLYRHYKGLEYKLLYLARHSETEEWMAVYQTQYGNFDYWVRPLSMFTEQVEIDGKSIPRFQYLSPA